jgi:hypothetical protein
MLEWCKQCPSCLHRHLFVCYARIFLSLLYQHWCIPDFCVIDNYKEGEL